MTRFSARARNGERGAVIVEGAVVAVVFFMFVFALIEYSLLLRNKASVNDAARRGVAVGRSAGQATDADFQIIDSVRKSLRAQDLNKVQCLIVYKATSRTDTVGKCTDPCGTCNVYSGAQVRTLTSGAFTGMSSSPDSGWFPSSRDTTRSAADLAACGTSSSCTLGTSFIGVFIEYNYSATTGIFPVPSKLTASYVMQLEAVSDV